MASGGLSSTNLEATAHSTDQQPDRITLSKGLTSQVILEILGMILAGRSLHEVLTSVVCVVEAQREDEGMLCSVWLLDQDRVHMRAIAAPTLPESYVAALDGFVVGPEGGACGAAVNRREPVFVSDVLTDPILEHVSRTKLLKTSTQRCRRARACANEHLAAPCVLASKQTSMSSPQARIQTYVSAREICTRRARLCHSARAIWTHAGGDAGEQKLARRLHSRVDLNMKKMYAFTLALTSIMRQTQACALPCTSARASCLRARRGEGQQEADARMHSRVLASGMISP